MTEKYSNEQLEMLIQSIIESENPSTLAIIAEQGFYHEQLMMGENEHIRAIVAKYTDNVKFLKALATDTDINIAKIYLITLIVLTRLKKFWHKTVILIAAVK